MWYAKVHAALVVFSVWMCGLFVDKSVPYFPIEISRTGTGPYSSLLFKWGAVSLIASLWMDGMVVMPKWPVMLSSPIPIWLCIVVIAWFPDHSHLLIHGAGVAILLLCVSLNAFFVGDIQRRFPIALAALGIEGARLVLKGFVVLFTELDRDIWSPLTYWHVLCNTNGLRDEIIDQIMNIMFKGTEYAVVPYLTIPMMRVTGVMQWLALYLLMCLY